MGKFDDLYTNPANTPTIYSGKTVKKPLHIVHDKDYIKKHIEVIAPVQYTDKLPMGAMVVVYAMMIFIVLSMVYDGYRVIKHIYLGLKNLLTGKDASCIMW